jgi:tetratricopeptide (TPR) repeat protein
MSARAAQLRNLLEQDPGNSFLRYALAMDHVSSGDWEQAMSEFRTLVAADPDYCAAYYHGGQTLEKLGRTEEAALFYRDGIAATLRKGDAHTRSEIEAALSLIS